ncbi:Zn-ribbon domain-containing OB-fold protein [Lederbergia lenta]|uniref:Predicted nucleic-acid-binding protein containing a Zn-ribbon n=1 Tax=Lederbergia lenta TaxID=1467 RepID=A0A2X4VNE9_LEDLE|nr:OB-fold domain-containing protein [Lederbergia lenta]MCM3110797.1 OB-fold domain-containing protein [Lederbergia lenta]MEC2325808.1 OB-fold domain-containing protein [Lederbergia lenta]SQI53717.1 Predicted nucleic-acid-binding protein containing a Zn-ribbon [Lederbergia lenta]
MIENYEKLNVPGPTITSVSKPFWDAVAQKEFILQKCIDCHEWVFYPRTICPHCWSDQLEWIPASGKGRLKTWGVVHKPGHPAWSEVAPYVLGIVELDEGPTMMSHLLLDPKRDLHIGLPLEVSFTKCNTVWLPFFKRSSNY